MSAVCVNRIHRRGEGIELLVTGAELINVKRFGWGMQRNGWIADGPARPSPCDPGFFYQWLYLRPIRSKNYQ